MKFTLTHQRAMIGNDINVQVIRENNGLIALVVTTLDQLPLGEDPLSPPEVSYTRMFPQAGNAAVGMTHKLSVTATDDKGNEQSSSEIWKDPV